jgi:hypothetical protein
MNWEAIGAISETVGAVTVVVSLLYVAIQLRTQISESRIAAMHEIGEAYRDATKALGDITVATIIEKSHQDFDALTESEMIVLIISYLSVFRVCEEAFIQFELGRLDRRYWNGIERETKIMMSLPSVRKFWSMRHYLFDEAFQRYVSSLPETDWDLK